MTTKKQTCSICDETYTGWGNNAWPVNNGRCCDRCNTLQVIPARIKQLIKPLAPNGKGKAQ